MANTSAIDIVVEEYERGLKGKIAVALGEGDNGKIFTQWAQNNAIQTDRVIEDALARFRQYRRYWPVGTLGAFAQNYVETVYKAMEPHTPGFALPTDQIAWKFHIHAIWDEWAKLLGMFADGTEAYN